MKIITTKIKDPWTREGVNEYAKRVPRLDITEKKELLCIADKGFIIALSEEGEQFSSIGFARLIKKIALENKEIVFVIGGPDGLPNQIKAKADLIVSLSKMTFTHEMALLFLVEQIYRAMSIIKNKKYHRK